ncbi:uroporphyrin-III C-methyltransferase [Thermanaerovibrio velox DSM 12556]|uniref:uroporphyrinogen-III C-methyltransferase n=1 Tax=Thermanaerovibrio velox DSM 12556 TaxID=926567 RepID=H0UMV5_9BACT|nr:uroporphyrinogen-III C-methyltransferase [Thermanaerovibrio velox]EHM09250.1 uroporphyrin-III C-methyltransferase [Thermanaerovibrio velox DSM 12556]
MIWLVGAGCGSPRWLTLEALQVLSGAQAVVYDRLIHPDCLLLAPKGALFIEAGKRGGDHRMEQEEINRLLVDLGRRFKTVIRLKGGDPFVFGRGGEEAAALDRAGLEWRAVPGITAALGGFLAEGIPLTHRGVSSGLCLVTGKLGDATDPQGYFEGIASFKGSRVLYMSASSLVRNLRLLTSLGLSPQTPCGILSWGGWGRGCLERTTLEGAIGMGEAGRLASPSVILLGEAAHLELKPAPLPLKGLQVAVCRPMGEGYSTARELEGLGADAFTLPLLEEETAVQEADVIAGLREANWLVFTSPRGPRVLKDLIKDLRHIRCSTVAIGPGTASAMEDTGIGVDLMPQRPNSESLGELLRGVIRPGERVLFLRNRRSSRIPVEAVAEARGLPVEIPIYEMKPRDIPWMGLIREHWEDHPPQAVVFGSAALAEEWSRRLGGLPGRAKAVAWGDECAKACMDLFGGAVAMKTPDSKGLVDALKSLLSP